MAGEPMLSLPDIKKSLIFLNQLSQKVGKPIHTYMPTNGTLLDDSSLNFFRKYNHKISLSIDSLDSSYNYRSIKGNNMSSVPILLQKLKLFQKYQDIIRIKMVVMPETISGILPTFQKLCDLGFHFINIQPAHGVMWSEFQQQSYIAEILKTKILTCGLENLKSTTFKGSEREENEGPKHIGCAKGRSEIFIDAYGKIYVCDAFLSYPIDKRKEFSHDDLYNLNFDAEKFEKYRDWKYCDNTVIQEDEKDITKCETCDETKSCSTLCNALPNNNGEYKKDILISNFNLYRKLDKIGI